VPRPLTLGKALVHGEIKKPHTPTHYNAFHHIEAHYNSGKDDLRP